MKIQYVLHADFELPGMIENWATKHQFKQHYWRPFAGEKKPEIYFDLLVIMGGPQSFLNVAEFPYLRDEVVLIKNALQAEIPILGFCLGAQLIGEALGAATERSPHKEVGFFPLQLTAEGINDSLLAGLPQELSVFHWHNDMPGLTRDAQILAASKGCPRQIIRYTPLAYGFQCHLEPTMQNIEMMIAHCPEDLKPGTYVQTVDELRRQNLSEMHDSLLQILDNLMSLKLQL